MTIHSYLCPEHGEVIDTSRRDRIPCPITGCMYVAKRNWRSVQLGTPAFTPHFNYSVGKYVSNEREFKVALAQASENNSQLTGVDHHYEPILPGDMKPPTDATDALENQARTWRDSAV